MSAHVWEINPWEGIPEVANSRPISNRGPIPNLLPRRVKIVFFVIFGMFLLSIGIYMLYTGVLTALHLYQGFGHEKVEQELYGRVGACIVIFAGLMLLIANLLWFVGFKVAASFCFVIWVVLLLPIGLQSHLGFMATSQDSNQQQQQHSAITDSINMKIIAADLSEVEREIKSLARYANLDIASYVNRIAELQHWIKYGDGQQEDCCTAYSYYDASQPQRHDTQRINKIIEPWKQRIRQLQAWIEAHKEYQTAVKQKREILRQMDVTQNHIKSANIAKHPLFALQSEFFGIDREKAQKLFVIGTAIAYEVILSLTIDLGGMLNFYALLLIFAATKHEHEHVEHEHVEHEHVEHEHVEHEHVEHEHVEHEYVEHEHIDVVMNEPQSSEIHTRHEHAEEIHIPEIIEIIESQQETLQVCFDRIATDIKRGKNPKLSFEKLKERFPLLNRGEITLLRNDLVRAQLAMAIDNNRLIVVPRLNNAGSTTDSKINGLNRGVS